MMTLKLSRNNFTLFYEGETKFECLTALMEDYGDRLFSRTIDGVSDMLRTQVSPMVEDEDVALIAFETVAECFHYKVEWEGEEE